MEPQENKKSFKEKISKFKEKPGISAALELGKGIVVSAITTYEKRELFEEIFQETYSVKIESIFNMWAVAAMLEHPDTAVARKIASARELLRDDQISDDELNEWIHFIWVENPLIEEDLKEFLASDYRNLARSRLNKENMELLDSY